MGRWGVRLPSAAVAYGCTSFASAALHSVFVTYYVHVYLDVFRLSSPAFYWAQLLFMLWNCVNDPLAALLLPSSLRIAVLRHGGGAWSLAFALLFLPLACMPLGLHFLLALCLYDAMLSAVLLVHASLLADLATSGEQRAAFAASSSLFSLLGSCSVLAAQLYWDVRAVGGFQAFVCLLALAAFASFHVSASLLAPHVPPAPPAPSRPSSRILGQVLRLRNFWLFVAVNLLQVFNCHFNSNFMGLAMEHLLGLEAGLTARGVASLLLLSTSLLPHLLVLLLAPLAARVGLHSLLAGLFALKGLLALLLPLLASPSSHLLVGAFLVANKSCSEAICRHGNLVVADICDEDRATYRRQASASSLVFGANALLTKAGQSLAPMLGWYLLHLLGYPSHPGLAHGLFTMLWLVPLACAAVQLLLWSRFTLRGQYLEQVRSHKPEPV